MPRVHVASACDLAVRHTTRIVFERDGGPRTGGSGGLMKAVATRLLDPVLLAHDRSSHAASPTDIPREAERETKHGRCAERVARHSTCAGLRSGGPDMFRRAGVRARLRYFETREAR
jgi:hypothetical protein